MKKKLHLNSMVVRILATVIIGIFCAVTAASAVIIKISENVFVDTYGKSQEQVFFQIEDELNHFHENLNKIIDAVNSSWAFRLYLRGDEVDPQLEFQTAYKMNQDLKKAIPSNINDISVMLIGVNGKSYLSREETIIYSPEEILESDITKNAEKEPDLVKYQYAQQGLTSTTRNSPVLMATKALTYLESGEIYAYIYITIKETDVSKFYNFFTSETSRFFIVDEGERIVSSNRKELVGQQAEDEFFWIFPEEGSVRITQEIQGRLLTVLEKELPYYNYKIFGIIDNEKALGKLYDVPQLWILCIGIAAIVVFLTFLAVRQTTRPLWNLVRKMSRAREEKYDEHIEVKGSEEVQELSNTYNYMLDDLNRYIDELMTIQKEKRKAEISALQMQINPHYVYNTLASIKWLFYQGNVEKATNAIDAFITLLRSTIGNSDEFISVERAVDNLKCYVLINNNRYGDRVNVEYFVNYGCECYMIPKMILQPFVENAFFHAFPFNRKGNIEILVRTFGENLQIQIVDDGVGMDREILEKVTSGHAKSEHFTGIGVHNVHDRLKLLYGDGYGIDIHSQKDVGTNITILLPANREDDIPK